MKNEKISEKLPPHTNLFRIKLFDFRLRQDIEGRDTKNGTKGNIEQIESANHHSADTTRILILEETLAISIDWT